MSKAEQDVQAAHIKRLMCVGLEPRDLWPTPPTREECVEVRFPVSYPNYETLVAVWPALTIEDKEVLGFLRRDRALKIARLMEEAKEARTK